MPSHHHFTTAPSLPSHPFINIKSTDSFNNRSAHISPTDHTKIATVKKTLSQPLHLLQTGTHPYPWYIYINSHANFQTHKFGKKDLENNEYDWGLAPESRCLWFLSFEMGPVAPPSIPKIILVPVFLVAVIISLYSLPTRIIYHQPRVGDPATTRFWLGLVN
ncbi:hypothetical protein HanXRQr2_Chr10g0455471 [Helianthus annuus]|uniref:Uncharacterized protein n=1 Tax=Helianthus annuus TaxID=4232 RepID=A0A9K3N5X1_HELAN|nr:hypothetical protein HanXRQr2_Chr10g0455471 [Helianthus annuus]KAJ0884966.1 hypothetical protein HanPSC8_Chr10g0439921 [Helianthus annuus]